MMSKWSFTATNSALILSSVPIVVRAIEKQEDESGQQEQVSNFEYLLKIKEKSLFNFTFQLELTSRKF